MATFPTEMKFEHLTSLVDYAVVLVAHETLDQAGDGGAVRQANIQPNETQGRTSRGVRTRSCGDPPLPAASALLIRLSDMGRPERSSARASP